MKAPTTVTQKTLIAIPNLQTCRTLCTLALALVFLIERSQAAQSEDSKPHPVERDQRGAKQQKAIDNEPIALSPFVVTTSKDRGYEAENTLSGTRLNTPAKFVGVSVSEITQALMQDLALFSTEDLVEYTTNASAYGSDGSLVSDTQLIGAETGPRFNIRGLVVTTTSRDFINTRVADDAYNTDRISVDRGPNAVLFGVGDPGGIVNAVSTRAVMKNSINIATRCDNWGSHRGTFRLNHVLLKDRAAIFLAGLDEDKERNITPSDWRTHRLYGTITLKPLKSTTVTASFEHGRVANVIAPPWPASDGIGAWLDAGSQDMPASLQNGGYYNANGTTRPSAATQASLRNLMVSTGFQLSTRSGATLPIYVIDSTDTHSLPSLNDLGFVQTAGRTSGIARVPNATLLESPIPYTANLSGYGNQRQQHFQNYNFTIEQWVGKDLFISATFDRKNTNQVVNRTAFVAFDQLYLDKSSTILTMDNRILPNPNYNKYYVMMQGASALLQEYDDDTSLLQAAYKLDLKEKLGGKWGKILGHHSLSILRQFSKSGLIQSSSGLTNFSPQSFVGVTPQFNPLNQTIVNGGANTPIPVIRYLDPANSSTWAAPDLSGEFGGVTNPLYAGSQVPTAGADGLALGWLAQAQIATLTKIDTMSGVMQNFFWDDRIVTTFGWRRDKTHTWSLPLGRAPSYNGQTGWLDDLHHVNPYTGDALHPLTEYQQTGRTNTKSIVIYPIPSIGLFFNQSENFQPAIAAQQVDIFGNPLPGASARGRDWGIKFSLLKNRVVGALTRYDIRQTDVATAIFRSGFGGTFPQGMQNPLNALANTMFTLTNSDEFTTYPWPTSLPWYSTNDVVAKGYELSFTANITPNWRLIASLSKQSAVSSNYGDAERGWYETQYQYISTKYPQFLNAAPVQNGARGVPETVAEDFQDIMGTIDQAQSLAGRTDARQAKYAAHLVTAYDFSSGALKGLGLGATYRWRSREAIGYGFQPGSKTLFNADNVYYGPSRDPVGMFVSYRFELSLTRVKIQLNADNINMSEELYPFTKTDSGNGTPVVSKYAVGPGKTFAFSASFDL